MGGKGKKINGPEIADVRLARQKRGIWNFHKFKVREEC
jgi:hypothetical protein